MLSVKVRLCVAVKPRRLVESVPDSRGHCSYVGRAIVAAPLTPVLAVGARLIVVAFGAMDTTGVAGFGDLTAFGPWRVGRSRRRSSIATLALAPATATASSIWWSASKSGEHDECSRGLCRGR